MAEEEQRLKKAIKNMPISEAYKTAEKKESVFERGKRGAVSAVSYTGEKFGSLKEKVGKGGKEFLKRQKSLENKKERETYKKSFANARTKEIRRRASREYKAVHSYTPPHSVFGESMLDFGNVGTKPGKSPRKNQPSSMIGDLNFGNIGLNPNSSPSFELPRFGHSKGKKKRSHQYISSPI